MVINDNIKLIRELSGKTQVEFAKLIKTNVSNLKTYENTDVKPKAFLIWNISQFAGVSTDDLENKKLKPDDIYFQDEKDEEDSSERRRLKSNDLNIPIQEYINELREDKRNLQEDKRGLQSTIDTNLTALMQLLAALSRHDRAFHETILRSLARLEGNNIDLITEARSYEAAKQVEETIQGSNASVHK